MTEYLGWAATAIMLIGAWMVGRKNAYGFLLQLAGNLGWAIVGVSRGMQMDLIFVSVLFVCMYVRNFYLWIRGHT